LKINIDNFTKNIISVFIGSFLASFLSLLYQLLIAHKFYPAVFAAFNSLLSLFTIISIPILTFQTAIAKYSAEFLAHNNTGKVTALLSGFLKKNIFFSAVTLIIFYYFSLYITAKLKVDSNACVYILSLLFATCWIVPVLMGGAQGLELFGWYISALLISSVLKLILAFVFVIAGFHIAGALGAFLGSNILVIVILLFALRRSINFRPVEEKINYKEIFAYLFPISLSLFCLAALVNMDMVLVRYFFSPQDSGFYSLSQMVGKIFLFLPASISVALLPRASGLKAKNIDALHILSRCLSYAVILCAISILIYNFFPGFILKALTGKAPYESVALARIFSVSMSFFALSSVLITYFLSQKDLRFIKYLIFLTLSQGLAIIFLHPGLMSVQLILCVTSILLFITHLALAYRRVV